MSLAFDEFGRPFIIIKVNACDRTHNARHSAIKGRHTVILVGLLQEQEKKQRIRGIDAQKAHIKSAKAIARILRSSLGPNGMDKLLQGPDGDVCISKTPSANLPDHAACHHSQTYMLAVHAHTLSSSDLQTIRPP